MEELLDSLWALSGAMETTALIAMLAGLFLVALAAAKSFRMEETERRDIRRSKPWRTGWGAVGVGLVLFGIVLDAFAIWVRLGPPGRF